MKTLRNSLSNDLYSIDSYDYELPRELVAQTPVIPRDRARMMVVYVSRGSWIHSRFDRLPEFLEKGDVVVANNSRVRPARLSAAVGNPGGKLIELLFVDETKPGSWQVLARPARMLKSGTLLYLPGNLRATVQNVFRGGYRELLLDPSVPYQDYLEIYGSMPIPPYIRRGRADDRDKTWYQTVFAQVNGSIAAPTAGLHVTKRIQEELIRRGVLWSEITLHVGPGTFRPVRTPDIRKHRLEPETFKIPKKVWHEIIRAESQGNRVIAIGTTTTRALEACAAYQPPRFEGKTDLFIYPGYRFRIVNTLLTNFHLPRSSLLMLVCALAGRDLILAAYREAVRKEYRFYSYGDCMLILP